MISAIAGLGDRLVSGEEDGEDWTVNDIATCTTEPTVLTAAEALAISALARRAEATFGTPQDVEWALDTDGLHILQSRPITTPLLPMPTPDGALTIFDNSNIVESYPGLVSPLTYSFAVHVYGRVYRAFVSLLGVPETTIATNSAVFGNMLGRIDGRVYYNLVNWYRALALLPGFSLNRTYMETMMGVDTPMPGEVTDNIGPPPAQGAAKALEYLRLARAGLGLIWQAILLPSHPATVLRAAERGARQRLRSRHRQPDSTCHGVPQDRGDAAGPLGCAARQRFPVHDRLWCLSEPDGALAGRAGAGAAQ